MPVRPIVLQSLLKEMLEKQFSDTPEPLQQWAQGPLRNYMARRYYTPEDEIYAQLQTGDPLRQRHQPRLQRVLPGFPDDFALPQPLTPSARGYAYDRPFKDYEDPEKLLKQQAYEVVGPQPRYLARLPTDTARLGALTDAWLRKWTQLGTAGKGWTQYGQLSRQYFPQQAKLWSEVVNPLQRELDTPKRSFTQLPQPVSLRPEMAENIQDIFRRYFERAGGKEEFGAALEARERDLRARLSDAQTDPNAGRVRYPYFLARPTTITDVASPAQILFRAQTSPLKQMYEYDPTSGAPYGGAKFRGAAQGGKGSRTPFVEGTLAQVREKLFREEPWLARWTPEMGPLRELYNLTDPVRHIRDILVDDLAAGRVRPEVLPRMSVREAAQRAADWDRNAARRAAEKTQRETAALLADPKGTAPVAEYPEGWRVDQITNADRLTKESCAAGATWCTRSDAVAKQYLREGPFYLLRDPTGIARVAFQADTSGRVRQIRNRKQTGEMSDEVRPFVQRFLTEHRGVQSVDPLELQRTGLTTEEWRRRQMEYRKSLLKDWFPDADKAPPPEKRAGGSIHAR